MKQITEMPNTGMLNTGPTSLDSKSQLAGSWCWLLLITGLALALRMVGLNWESIWYDEADSLRLASSSFSELLSGKELTPGNPNGYFALLRAWCLTFGFSIESARALSAVTGALAVPCVWLLANRATINRATVNRSVVVTASLLTAVNPALVFLGREARVFALMSTLITLAVFFMVDIISRSSKRSWIGLAITSAISIHMHYNTFFFLAVLPWPILWSGRSRFWTVLGKLVGVYLIVGIAFFPWISTFWMQLLWETTREVNSWILHAIFFPVYAVAGRTFIWKQDGVVAAAIAELVVVFAVLLPLVLRQRERTPFFIVASSVVIGVPLAAMVVSLTISPVFNGRYVSFVLPCLMVVLAVGIHQMTAAKWWSRHVPTVLLGAVICCSLVRLYSGTHKDDWRGLSQYIARENREALVVFYEDIGSLPHAYYQPQQPRLLLPSPIDPDGALWKSARYPEATLQYDDVWVAVSPLIPESDLKTVVAPLERSHELEEVLAFQGIKLLRYRQSTEYVE